MSGHNGRRVDGSVTRSGLIGVNRTARSLVDPTAMGPASPGCRRRPLDDHLGPPGHIRHRTSLRPPPGPARPCSGDNDVEWDVDWKFLAVRQMVEQDPRPFVWIDDDIDFLRDEALSPREFSPRTGAPQPS
jgi:hypothetical protein